MRCSVCNFLCIGYFTLPNGIRLGFCLVHPYPGILSEQVTALGEKFIVELPDGKQYPWTFSAFAEHVRKTPHFKNMVKEN